MKTISKLFPPFPCLPDSRLFVSCERHMTAVNDWRAQCLIHGLQHWSSNDVSEVATHSNFKISLNSVNVCWHQVPVSLSFSLTHSGLAAAAFQTFFCGLCSRLTNDRHSCASIGTKWPQPQPAKSLITFDRSRTTEIPARWVAISVKHVVLCCWYRPQLILPSFGVRRETTSIPMKASRPSGKCQNL